MNPRYDQNPRALQSVSLRPKFNEKNFRGRNTRNQYVYISKQSTFFIGNQFINVNYIHGVVYRN